MKKTKEDHVQYRVKNSKEAFEDAMLLVTNGRWTACINRLYYSCFYAVSALLYKYDLYSKTHSGTKTLFYKEFVQKKIISFESADLFSHLFNWRTQNDYFDFTDFNEETVKPLLDEVEKFNKELLGLIEGK